MKIAFTNYFLHIFALALVLGGCMRSGVNITNVVLGEQFTLRVGEKAMIKDQNLTLTFAEVIQDARCPLQVNCYAMGAVEILVFLQIQDGEAATFEMNPELVLVPDNWAPQKVNFFGYEVQLVRVDPYPETLEDKEHFENYQATFVITEGK